MSYFAAAGTKTYIGGILAMKGSDFIESDFTSQTWVEVGGVITLGSFGDTAPAIDVTSQGDQRSLTVKGLRSAGTLEMVCNIDYADAGQLALIAAEKTEHDYAFKIVFNDAPPGGTPSERKMIGKVMSAREQLDEANSVARLSASVALNSNVVRKAAEEEV